MSFLDVIHSNPTGVALPLRIISMDNHHLRTVCIFTCRSLYIPGSPPLTRAIILSMIVTFFATSNLLTIVLRTYVSHGRANFLKDSFLMVSVAHPILTQ